MSDPVEVGKARAAGIVSILIGICALIELICGFIYLSKGGPEGSGLWSGFGLAIIAILGIVTWLKKNKIAMVFYLVMCILWFIVCLFQITFAWFGWVFWSLFTCFGLRRSRSTVFLVKSFVVQTCEDYNVIANLFLCMLIVSAIAAILTLAGSIIGCMGTCCARPEGNVVVIQQPAGYPMVMQQTQQQVYPAQQPVMMADNAPPPDYGIQAKE